MEELILLIKCNKEKIHYHRYHWIRDALETKQLLLEKIHTDKNGSYMITKISPTRKYAICKEKASLVYYDPN